MSVCVCAWVRVCVCVCVYVIHLIYQLVYCIRNSHLRSRKLTAFDTWMSSNGKKSKTKKRLCPKRGRGGFLSIVSSLHNTHGQLLCHSVSRLKLKISQEAFRKNDMFFTALRKILLMNHIINPEIFLYLKSLAISSAIS